MLKGIFQKKPNILLGISEILIFFIFYFITIFFGKKVMLFTGLESINTPIGTDQIKIDPRFITIRVIYLIGTFIYVYFNIEKLISPVYKEILNYINTKVI